MDFDISAVEAATRGSSHVTISTGVVGGASLSGDHVVAILRKLAQRQNDVRVETVNFVGLEISGAIKLHNESSGSLVPTIAFTNCEAGLIFLFNCNLASLQILACRIDRLICTGCSFSKSLGLVGCKVAGKLELPGIPAGAVNVSGISAQTIVLMHVELTGEPNSTSISMIGCRCETNIELGSVTGATVIDLTGSRIDGSLVVEDCVLATESLTGVLNLSSVRVGVDVRLARVRCGWLSLDAATIDGRALIEEARIGYEADQAGGVMMRGLSVAKMLEFSKTELKGQMRLDRATIGAHMRVENCVLANDQDDCFHAEGPTLRGALLFHNTQCHGPVFVIHGEIGVNIEFKACRVLAPNTKAVDVYATQCSGDIMIFDTVVNGQLSICNGSAQRLDIRNTEVAEYHANAVGSYAIKVVGASFHGGIFLTGLKAVDDLSFSDTSARLLRVFDLTMTDATNKNKLFPCSVHFSRMTVASYVEFGPVSSDNNLMINLADTKCANVIMNAYKTRTPNEEVHILLEINGFEYSAIGWYMDRNELRTWKALVDSSERIKRVIAYEYAISDRNKNTWLQGAALATIPRQPRSHVQLAKVLKMHGWDNEARNVLWSMRKLLKWEPSWAHASRWRSFPAFLGRGFSGFLFDRLFGYGYGYGKGNAALTVLAWLVLGWLGTQAALDRGMLVIDPTVVSDVSAPGLFHAGRPISAGNPTETASCKGAIEPLFYAVDLLVPLIDFGQARKCAVPLGPEEAEKGFLARESTYWLAAQYLYSLVGWIILSFSALTFTGTLRQRLD